MIYFIRCTGSGRIKIGFTTSPIGRLQNIMNCNAYPVELLAAVEGSRHVECAYHDLLIDSRVHGEWFEPSASVQEQVAAAVAGIVLDPAPQWSASRGWAEKQAQHRLIKNQIIPAMLIRAA